MRVLHDVELRLGTGEVLGLLGDNGAGKSTLIKIITGSTSRTSGEISSGKRVEHLTCGRRGRWASRRSTRSGPSRTSSRCGATSSWAGRVTRFGFLDVGKMRRVTAELMGESMGFTSAILTPDTAVTGLSGGERQGLAIVRALHFEAELIILDEPTMGLSLSETEKCSISCEGIRAAGKSAIFIDHNIFHVYSVSDRIVIIDRGRDRRRVPDVPLLADELSRSCARSPRPGPFTEPERYRCRWRTPSRQTEDRQ